MAESKSSLTFVDQSKAADLAGVGVLLSGAPRSGTYLLEDAHMRHVAAQSDGLELLPIASALTKYDWLRERYFWHAVPRDLDEVTAECAADAEPLGYFVRVHAGAKVEFPCQSALLISQPGSTQRVHNVVILEPGSELHLITGCLTHCGINAGLHLAVSEMYVGANAAFTNTMVHSWGPGVEVSPRAGIIVEEGATFTSNYVSLHSAKRMKTNPRIWLNGKGASTRYHSIIVASEGALIDNGGQVYLNGQDASAEFVHRAVSTGGIIYQRGLLFGNAPCRAHVDCSGMLLGAGDAGFIQAVPGLRAVHPDAQMSHEASIGKIAPEQVEYLQARGLSEQQAISMIIRGFLAADIAGLGPELDARIAELARLAGSGHG